MDHGSNNVCRNLPGIFTPRERFKCKVPRNSSRLKRALAVSKWPRNFLLWSVVCSVQQQFWMDDSCLQWLLSWFVIVASCYTQEDSQTKIDHRCGGIRRFRLCCWHFSLWGVPSKPEAAIKTWTSRSKYRTYISVSSWDVLSCDQMNKTPKKNKKTRPRKRDNLCCVLI